MTVANVQISSENRADASALSGGSWQPTLPLSNLLQWNLAFPARSVDALATSTRIDMDLGNATTVLRLIGVMRHNLSLDATYRITGGSTVGGAEVYDSGTLTAWPRVYSQLALEFEDPRWWTCQISEVERLLYPIKLLHDLGGNKLARYWRIQFTDTANPAGYVEVTRLWAGPTWQPRANFIPGASIQWEPRDRAVTTRAGVRYGESLPSPRVVTMEFDALNEAEAFARMLDLQRRLGSEGELVIIPDPDALSMRHRLDIYARPRSWAPVSWSEAVTLHGSSFVLEERL